MKPSEIKAMRNALVARNNQRKAAELAEAQRIFGPASKSYLGWARKNDPDAAVEHAAKFDADDESRIRR